MNALDISVFIIDRRNRLSDIQRSVLEENTAAFIEERLARHEAMKARYAPVGARCIDCGGSLGAAPAARGNCNACFVKELAGTSSDASQATGGGSLVDAGNHRSGKPCTTPDADHCPGCGAAEFGPEHDRVVVDYETCTVVPCPTCRAAEHASFKKRQADVDPWDLDSEELFTTCDLPRENPAYWGRDRADYDAHDDRADIQPHSRTEKA